MSARWGCILKRTCGVRRRKHVAILLTLLTQWSSWCVGADCCCHALSLCVKTLQWYNNSCEYDRATLSWFGVFLLWRCRRTVIVDTQVFHIGMFQTHLFPAGTRKLIKLLNRKFSIFSTNLLSIFNYPVHISCSLSTFTCFLKPSAVLPNLTFPQSVVVFPGRPFQSESKTLFFFKTIKCLQIC